MYLIEDNVEIYTQEGGLYIYTIINGQIFHCLNKDCLKYLLEMQNLELNIPEFQDFELQTLQSQFKIDHPEFSRCTICGKLLEDSTIICDHSL
jgi:hypothetical protein